MNKFLLGLLFSCAIYTSAFAQDTSHTQIKRNITLGFQTGVQLNNCPPYQYLNKKIGKYQYTNRFIARKKITNHFDIETGVNYTVIPMGNTLTQGVYSNRFRSQSSQLSIPLSVQYNFRSQSKRLRPYISVGGIYDIIKLTPPATRNVYTDGNIPNLQNNRNLGAIVTQGVIYEVNTKIQFNENIHFIQQGNCKCVGFDIGIGYKL